MGPLADPPPPKGILRPSSLGAPRGDASSTPRGDDDPPTMPGRADAAVTTTFDAFHDRVGAVFANLGPGLRDAPAPRVDAVEHQRRARRAPGRAPSGRRRTRRSRRRRRGGGDVFLGRRRRGRRRAARPVRALLLRRRPILAPVDLGDLDCLGSDVEAEPGDDSEAMRRMRRSVGRCDALDAEEEYDRFDDVALGGGRDAFADASDASGGSNVPAERESGGFGGFGRTLKTPSEDVVRTNGAARRRLGASRGPRRFPRTTRPGRPPGAARSAAAAETRKKIRGRGPSSRRARRGSRTTCGTRIGTRATPWMSLCSSAAAADRPGARR